ncbi:Putative membrane protein [Dokdonella koreensis DS-123]|uniref:Membrane protein n=2 Tax=Dokdonella TaxID=323413 RepID=A0A167GM65_9GAMM|nr:Putative membrane protein [Dokdonella koreensis DS-123]
MSLMPLIVTLFVIAAVCLALGLGQAVAARRRWSARRRLRAGARAVWSVSFLAIGLAGLLSGLALLGYRRLTDEALVAQIATQRLGDQRYALRIELPDGNARTAELTGDQWQLDARVIKWRPAAVMLGAPPLYRIDRLTGRYRLASQATERPPAVVDLAPRNPLDLWSLKHRYPRWLPWIDADFGSAAYLPMVDGGRFVVTLAPTGGLVARPADAATEERLREAGW